jgi:hypothetical protein
MATAALDEADCPPAAVVSNDGFPWRRLLLVWLAVSAVLVVRFWHAIVTQDYTDADDLMRLLEVRDLIGGQNWFDLTQYRLDPPAGLHSHWSRLVDLPLVALIAPLTPLVGRTMAETIATTVVPLVTLGLTMAAALVAVRRTVSRDPLHIMLVPVMIVTSPAILAQMFPTRIDHHGWQICLGASALAALLDSRPRRSGAIAGVATALLMAISLEGLPYAVAVTGSLALLWIAARERSERLVVFMIALAMASIVAFVATAPTLRWTTDLCDVVKPAHLAVFALAAAGSALAVGLTATRGIAARLGAFAIVALASAALFGWLAPNCLGSPFGAMDPLVRHYWYDNVLEGRPITVQPLSGVAAMLVYPLVGLAGAAVALRGAAREERRRRWLLVILLGLATFATGLAVRRAAGLSHLLAIPGALVLFDLARRRIEAMPSPLCRVPLIAAALLGLSPAMPTAVAALIAPDPPPPLATTPPDDCGWRCDVGSLGALPPATFFTEIDEAPHLIAFTEHHAYAAAYHRLERPLHDTIAVFTGSTRQARGILCTGRFDYVLIAPSSGETRLYRRAAPGGFLDTLLRRGPPYWLTPISLPSPALRAYRVAAPCRNGDPGKPPLR